MNRPGPKSVRSSLRPVQRLKASSRSWMRPELSTWRAKFVSLFLAAALLAIVGCGGAPIPSTLASLTIPNGQVYESGMAANVILPAGITAPNASDVTISMTPLTGGQGYTLAVQSVTAGSGGTSILGFTLPSLTITAPTQYFLVATGKNAMSAFTTSPALQITVIPGAQVVSVNPASAQAGATLNVSITGVTTSWVNGTTTASFGAGISVGGAAEGAQGPVQVTSATTAMALLALDPAAAAGSRNVTVNTGSQSLTLSGGFLVNAAAKPPTPNAGGPYTGTTGQPVAFSAAGSSDPAGLALTFAWSFGDGTTGTGVTPSHTYTAAGKYTATVTATNSAGVSASATATATITAAPQAPVANAGGPYTGTSGTAISFSGAGSSDPKGETLTYAWTFGDGSTGTGVAPTHTYANAGSYTVALTVTNTDSLSATATTLATVTSAPQPPVANAGGPYSGATGAAISFNASGSSDPRSETLTYAWTFGDGGTASGVTVSHTYTNAGTYTVSLKVTNTDNQSASITTTATVTAPQAPVANTGGPYTGAVGTAVQFSGAGSTDPKGETLSYAWTFGDGGTAAGATPVHTYSASGTFTVTLKATNTDNQSTTATTTATISTAAQTPVANAGGPYVGTTGNAVQFTGAASSDPKGEMLTYAWTFGDGGTASGATPTHAYANAGTFTVTLKVTNTDNLSSTATASVVITSPPQPPVANAGGPYTGTAGTAVSFTGAASGDPKNETLTYAWTFGDGSTGSGVTPSHTYTSVGTFTVSLKVTNTDNLNSTATTSIVVAGVPPVANTGGTYPGTAGTPVAFNGSGSSDPRGETLTYAWTFGDGGTSTAVSPSHTYANPGTYNVSLKVTNTDNLSTTATTTATISGQAPVANAGGPYTGTAGTAITFNGTGSSEPRGETLSYAWSFGDGSTGTGASPSHTFASAGTYTVTLTVTNTDNLSASATATATIATAPQPPAANAGGPYTGTAGTAVSFNGSGSSDPKGETLTYAWDFGDSSTGTGANPTHTYAAAGTFIVKLTVTNTDNLSASASTSATIASAPQAPVANASGPYTGTAGASITFNGSASSDPKGETLTYAWNFGDGTTGTGASPTHIYSAAGTFTVSLMVTNTDKLSNTATTSATIAAAPQAPTANAGGPYSGTAGTAITFSGAGSSDPKGETLSYAWNFGDGTTGTGVTTNHTYASSGTFNVSLTVTNTDNLSATATTAATIAGGPQVPTANPGGPYTGTVGTAISFSGSGSSDPKGETLSYAWNFGDGTTGTGVSTTHAYSAPGTFTVALTVTNTDNLSASATTVATVNSATAQPPVANAGGPYSGNTGAMITFNASASKDPNNESLSYAWTFGDGAAATGVMPTHAYGKAGSYTVTVTVTNTDGASASATATAVISAPIILAPVVNANGPYNGSAGSAVLFSAAGSYDSSNQTAGTSALTLSWDFGDGTQLPGPSPVHTYSAAGTFTVTLTAQNSSGTTSSTTTSAAIAASVVDPTTPKAVAGGPYSGKAGTAITFSGSGSSDPNNQSLTYSWDFGDGTGTVTGAQLSHTYVNAGTYSVTLTVYNGTTLSSASTVATIAGTPAAPLTANAGGPYSLTVNIPSMLDGTQTSDPSSSQLQYAWDFGDGSQGTGPRPLHMYFQQGTYTVRLNVTDLAGNAANASTTATVGGPPPETVTASAGGPYTGVTSQAITLDASGTTDNLTNTPSYSWSFGDGTTGTGQTPSHVYSTAGTYTATVTATSNSVTSTATATVTVATAVAVQITSPASNALFNANTVTVTGTLSAPNMTVTVNGIAATVSGTSFTASGVSLREGVNLLTATATGSNNSIGNGSVSVIMDATAPGVSIVTPSSGATLTSSSVTVGGLVNDIVTGTIGSNDVTVAVNGLPAQVSNRSYMLPNLTLVPGQNTITVVATDKVGNTSQVSETVQLLPANSQLSLMKISGDAQSGVVSSVLPQPLVVQLLSSTGMPVVGRPITFTVTRSDGNVEALPSQSQTLPVNSDANGKASILMQLGSRVGLGVNQVTVTTPGAAGQTVFMESSTVGAPALIKSVLGENQRGLLGEALAEGFQVMVQDASGNPVSGIPVNFTINNGDGTLDNPSPTTDSNGKAIATLTLGQSEGINNYSVTADFTGDKGQGVTFNASGFAAGPVSATSVSGTVLDSSNSPVVNATVRIANTTLSTVTNASGNFSLSGAPVGTVTLSVDGSTSTSTQTLPFLSFVLEDLPGQNNTLGKPIYLPFIDVNDAQTVGGDDPVTLTMTGVPGLAFTIAPHSVTFPDGTTVGKLSISQVKADMVPMAPVNGGGPDLIWTLQPAGTRFSVPVQVTLPNTQGLAPGTVQEFYQYDHDLEQFVSAGTSHVSADGSVIVSDPGFGITKAGWGHGPIIVTSASCGISCVSTNPCISSRLGRGCVCINTVNVNYACGTPKIQIGDNVYIQFSGCQAAGYCNADGTCSGAIQPAGQSCDSHDVCNSGRCNGRGTCVPYGHINDVVTNGGPAGGSFATNFQVTTELFAKKIQTLIENFTPKNWIHINVNPAGSLTQKTIHCCEETQKPGVEIDKNQIQLQVQFQAGQIPVWTPASVPLGIKVPDGQVFGLYVQPGGQFTIGGTHILDNCNAANTCTSATVGFGVTLAGGLNLPAGIINLNVNVATGIGATFSGGCGTLGYKVGLQPIVLTGQLKIFTYGTFQETYTYTPTFLTTSGSTPLPTF